MSSRALVVIGLFLSIILALYDVYLHGHKTDGKLQDQVEYVLENDEGLENNAPIDATVNDHWVQLEGDIANDRLKDELGEDIKAIAGVRGVKNNLRTINTEGLAELKEFIAAPPIEQQVDYVVKEDGTVALTGLIDDPALQGRIVSMFDAIAGVQGIEEQWVDDVSAVLEARLRAILRLHKIYFDFNKWTIRPESEPALAEISKALNEYPKLHVRIEGHTDGIGAEGYNLELSNKRANAVREALVGRGVAPERIDSIGYGETRPIASNATPETRAENRRIEFRVKN